MQDVKTLELSATKLYQIARELADAGHLHIADQVYGEAVTIERTATRLSNRRNQLAMF